MASKLLAMASTEHSVLGVRKASFSSPRTLVHPGSWGGRGRAGRRSDGDLLLFSELFVTMHVQRICG